MVLDLPEEACLVLEAVEPRAVSLLGRLSEAMHLAGAHSCRGEAPAQRSFLVSYEGDCLTITEALPPGRSIFPPVMRFPLKPCPDLLLCSEDPDDRVVRDLVATSLVVGAHAQSGGAVLLHGALAERQGEGVLLLGPSGRGKTTASRRLPPPWKSLSDDMALVVPRGDGAWSAHPWPTWSSFRSGAGGGSWDVRRGVQLGGLFFLVRAAEDHVERIGTGRAACYLMESFGQAWTNGNVFFPDKLLKSMRATAFENVCSLAGSVPAFLLHVTPEGRFWDKLDEGVGEFRRGR